MTNDIQGVVTWPQSSNRSNLAVKKCKTVRWICEKERESKMNVSNLAQPRPH